MIRPSQLIIWAYSWWYTISIIVIKWIHFAGMRCLLSFNYRHNYNLSYWLIMQMHQESTNTPHPASKRHHRLVCLWQPCSIMSGNEIHNLARQRTQFIPLSVARKIFVLTSICMLDDTMISLQQQLLSKLVLRLPPKYTTWQITEVKSLLRQW